MKQELAETLILTEQGLVAQAQVECLKLKMQRLRTEAERLLRQRLLWVHLLLALVGIYSFGGVFYCFHTGRAWLAVEHAFITAVAPMTILWSRRELERAFGCSMRRGADVLTVPTGAEYLLWLFLPREGREAAIGDTNETFEMMVERFDLRRAKLWYWGEVARSAWPLVSYLGERLLKWTFLGPALDWVRRHI